jgi:uncharacterized protein YndB with AHSA1/START domain
MAASTDPTIAEREIVVSRTIEGPRHLVFQAFSEARHLARWFGPNGFTLTTTAFDFRPQGEWHFTMHGPDGTDYPNWVQWHEIVPPERLVYRQGQRPGDPDAFQATVTLVEESGRTRITLRALLNTKAQRDEVVRKYNALEGAKETLGRLAELTNSFLAGAR